MGLPLFKNPEESPKEVTPVAQETTRTFQFDGTYTSGDGLANNNPALGVDPFARNIEITGASSHGFDNNAHHLRAIAPTYPERRFGAWSPAPPVVLNDVSTRDSLTSAGARLFGNARRYPALTPASPAVTAYTQPTVVQNPSRPVDTSIEQLIGMELHQLSDGLFTEALSSTVEEDREVVEIDEDTYIMLREEMRRMVEQRVTQIALQQRATIDPAGRFLFSRLAFRQPILPRQTTPSEMPNAGPDTPNIANSGRPRAIGFLRPSPASLPQIVPQIEPLPTTIAPESIPEPHHIDRSATPPIRSAAPSPQLLAGHVRGRHSPPL